MQGVWGSPVQMNPSGMRKTVGGIALSFVLAVVLGISGVIAPGGGAALGASTTLTILGGEVQVSRNGGAFTPAADGAIIGPGDVIRTAADARAVLTYFEGSTVSVEPSSELAIDEASSNPDGSTVVVMTQNLGRTWHVVTKLITGGSKYEVRTPAATASVRGTTFAVGVGQDASGVSVTEISATEGTVATAAPATVADPQPEVVFVTAGLRTTAKSTERRPEAPTPAPEPERKVTVTIGSADALVVDTLGRSNGYKDGKLVLQTPGAQVSKIDGKLVVTLPNIPDGRLATFSTDRTEDTEVTTTVTERGNAPVVLAQRIAAAEGGSLKGLEIATSAANGLSVRELDHNEQSQLKGPKVADAPKLEVQTAARPGLGVTTRPGAAGGSEARPGDSVGPRDATKPAETNPGSAPSSDESKKVDDKDSDGGRPPGGGTTGGAEAPAGADNAPRGGFVPNLPLQPLPVREVAPARPVTPAQPERPVTPAQPVTPVTPVTPGR